MSPTDEDNVSTADDPAESSDLPQSTTASRLDDAVARLGELDERELTEHPGVFDEIHAVLRQELAAPDQQP